MKNFIKSKKLLVSILLFLGVGGLVGGLSFITITDGSGLGMTKAYLKHAPVDNYFWPGIFLLTFMCIWPLLNLYGALKHKAWANRSIFLLGLVTMAWIVYETIVIRTFSPLQPTIFIIGLLLALNAKFNSVESVS